MNYLKLASSCSDIFENKNNYDIYEFSCFFMVFEEFLGKIKEKIHKKFEEKFWGLLHESWKTMNFENFKKKVKKHK